MERSIGKEVGQRVREIRLRKGLSQDDLSSRAGLNHSYISKLESGKTNSTLESLHKIALALDIPLQALFQEA